MGKASSQGTPLGELGVTQGWPRVVPITPDTAMLLGCTMAGLRRAACQLQVWGEDGAGRPVFRFRELRAVLGLPGFEGGAKPVTLMAE